MPSTTAINPRKLPRQARSAATVETILEAAARILESDGLERFNTNVVAEKAGVSVGSLYQYFPGKDALLAALLRAKRQHLAAALQQVAADSANLTLADALDAFISVALQSYLERPGLTASLDYAETRLAPDEETVDLKQQIVPAVASVLARHNVPEPAIAARDLSAIVRGMIDAGGQLGERQNETLELRIRRATYGYLGLALTSG